jgi:pimeloyl-ACP methyl ester carboxylesterase
MSENQQPMIFTRSDSDFMSGGLKCAGWLYRPDGAENPPVLIMAHGFAAERTFRLPLFAERFAAKGIAVFLFDYRNFGDSEGAPRNLVNPYRHIRDWEAALAHVKALPDVNTDKVALWGSSFSGGHVICVAARHPEIAAVVSQVPFVDGIASTVIRTPKDIVTAIIAGYRDLGRKLTFRSPYYVPAIGPPDEFAVMNTEECVPGYFGLIPEDSSWENKVPARVLLLVPLYSPMRKAGRVESPVLMVIAEKDSLIPIKAVEKTADRIKNVTLHRLSCNHFAPYVGELFEENVTIETKFLERNLFD